MLEVTAIKLGSIEYPIFAFRIGTVGNTKVSAPKPKDDSNITQIIRSFNSSFFMEFKMQSRTSDSSVQDLILKQQKLLTERLKELEVCLISSLSIGIFQFYQ